MMFFASRRIDSKLPKHQANYAKEMMAEEERLQRLLELKSWVRKSPYALDSTPWQMKDWLDGWDSLHKNQW